MTTARPDRDGFMFIADSGDIAEETTTLDVHCLTLRDNTERPETFTIGMDELKGTESEQAANGDGTTDGGTVEDRGDSSKME